MNADAAIDAGCQKAHRNEWAGAPSRLGNAHRFRVFGGMVSPTVIRPSSVTYIGTDADATAIYNSRIRSNQNPSGRQLQK